jgi:hypothetical protein
MPIYKVLRGGPFGPEEINEIARAYEEALKLIGLTDRSSPVAETIAERVIAIYKSGETDQHRIAEKAISDGAYLRAGSAEEGEASPV